MDGATVGRWRDALRLATDRTIRLPLWDFSPSARKAVLSERRRRFGIASEYVEPHGEFEELD